MKRLATVRHIFVRALIVVFASLPIAAQADVDDVILMWGTTTEQETMWAQDLGGGTYSNPNPSDVCKKVSDFVFENNGILLVHRLTDDTRIERTELGEALSECEDGDFDRTPTAGQSNIWLIYSSCSMMMGNGANVMRWTVPPLAEEAEMIFSDLASGWAYRTRLETELRAVSSATQGLAMGNLRDYDISGPQGSRQVTLRIDDDDREYQARKYEYSYMGDIGGVSDMRLSVGRIDSAGEAWIVPDAPGTDVVNLFYQNFSDHVRPAAGMGSMIDGMIKQMAGLTRHGIPVRTKQTTTVLGTSIQTVMRGRLDHPDGVSSRAGSGMKSESESTINRIVTLPGMAPQTCGATVIPEGIEVFDMNQIMAGGTGGASGGGAGSAGNMSGAGNPLASPEYQEALQQMEKEMANLTPQEKQMMEQFGLGSMLGGAMAAGDSAGAAGGAGINALSRGSNSGGPGNSDSGNAKPSSSDLTSDNLLESVQKHLDALGYNPGNTDGTPSVMTEVAISQFQAENNMMVTGKVTPQLLGILSAAVDK